MDLDVFLTCGSVITVENVDLDDMLRKLALADKAEMIDKATGCKWIVFTDNISGIRCSGDV